MSQRQPIAPWSVLDLESGQTYYLATAIMVELKRPHVQGSTKTTRVLWSTHNTACDRASAVKYAESQADALAWRVLLVDSDKHVKPSQWPIVSVFAEELDEEEQDRRAALAEETVGESDLENEKD